MNTRGIRNKNPLNIRRGFNWKGLSPVQFDKSFCQFESELYGVRAALCVLRTYSYKYHLTTIREVISRFAPSSDGNDVEKYCYKVRMNMIQCMYHDFFSNPSSDVVLLSSLSACISEIQYQKDDFLVNRWLNKKVPMFPIYYFLHAMAVVESNFSIDSALYKKAVTLL